MKTTPNISLYPDLIRTGEVFDAIEIHPVRDLFKGEPEEKGTCFVKCEPEDAELWSVYIHAPNNGWECIADCDTLTEAEQVKSLMEIAQKYYRP